MKGVRDRVRAVLAAAAVAAAAAEAVDRKGCSDR